MVVTRRVAATAVAWALVVPIAAWTLVRTFGLERGYPLVALVAYTPWAFVGAIVAAAAIAAMRRWIPLAAAGACVVALGAAVLPRAVPRSDDLGAGARPLRILTANVLRGDIDPERIVDLARRERADVLSIQELTPELAAGLRRAGLHDLMRGQVVEARGGAQGTGLYARAELRPLARIEGTVHAQARATMTLPGSGTVEVVAVHPPPPIRSRIDDWRRDLRALPPSNGRRILAGDFNATLDHAELRRILGTGYRDAAASVGAGWKRTWPARRRLPGVTIDHVFVDRGWTVIGVKVIALPPSDHKAVLAEVATPPNAPG